MTGDDFAGNAGTTGELNLYGSTSGILEVSTDDDWFAFNVEAGMQYRITFSEIFVSIFVNDGVMAPDGVTYEEDPNDPLSTTLIYTPGFGQVVYASVTGDEFDSTGLPLD